MSLISHMNHMNSMNQTRTLILASASPRRSSILLNAGFKFIVEPSPYEEEFYEGLPPVELALTLSAHKAAPVALKHPEAVVLAADTMVVLDDMVLGKPENEAHAIEMLRALSGHTHIVVTGFTVECAAEGKTVSRAVTTSVTFKRLTQEEIAAYVATGEPMDKAGAYGIQGKGARLLADMNGLDGDYLNVVGLPLDEVMATLKEFNIHAS